ncbi:hypothetical protein GEV33_006350 [Tenebrio molitor]|uniref:Uncharacterized protein n=1 Tax=Tenebrio molitor TaxID=7067 RepID=A0A8J6LDM7_TENMO|nr:hypothetical protein GEV33_006350 [Tenebrio molitor]
MYILLSIILVATTSATKLREGKNLPYFDYLAPDDYHYDFDMGVDANDIGRTVPKRKPAYNSPIYYIRLPPQPYMFVPGLGYISQPPPSPPQVSPFVSLPISFVANGKPSTIYQWAANSQGFGEPPKPSKPQPPADSTVHKLEGQFTFNGKPDNMFVLRDSYNSLAGYVIDIASALSPDTRGARWEEFSREKENYRQRSVQQQCNNGDFLERQSRKKACPEFTKGCGAQVKDGSRGDLKIPESKTKTKMFQRMQKAMM